MVNSPNTQVYNISTRINEEPYFFSKSNDIDSSRHI